MSRSTDPRAGLYFLSFRLEFAAGLVAIWFLGTEDECMPSRLVSVKEERWVEEIVVLKELEPEK